MTLTFLKNKKSQSHDLTLPDLFSKKVKSNDFRNKSARIPSRSMHFYPWKNCYVKQQKMAWKFFDEMAKNSELHCFFGKKKSPTKTNRILPNFAKLYRIITSISFRYNSILFKSMFFQLNILIKKVNFLKLLTN